MVTVRLTDTAIMAAAKRAADTGSRVELSDVVERGLRIRLTPNGAKAWVLACRDPEGRMRRFLLGGYATLGISDARRAAQSMREEVRKGADPIASARQKRATARDAKLGIGTLEALVTRYALQRGASLRSWAEQGRRIRAVFASKLDRPITSLSRFELQDVADSHGSPQSAAAAVRYLRPILKWAASRGVANDDLALISPPATIERRSRVLSRDELSRLLPTLRADRSGYGSLYLFLLLSLARREEAAGATWAEIDLRTRTWTIPDVRSKNGQAHLIPLSHQAAALLTKLGPEEPDNLVFATGTGRPLGNHDRATKALSKASETSGWSRHDLRRTGATMLGEMGETPDIIEAALNHVSIRSPLAATYNRSRYRPQVAAALQRLADALDGIEQSGGEIVWISGHRA